MRITIRFFARLREVAGRSQTERDVPEGSTVEAVWQVLTVDVPALAAHRGSLAAAVNEDFAGFGTVLHDGDVVALLPPVSGG